MNKDSIKDIYSQLENKSNKKTQKIDSYQIDAEDCEKIKLKTTCGGITDVFEIYSKKLSMEDREILGAISDLRVKYTHSESEEGQKIKGRVIVKEGKIALCNYPTVKGILEDKEEQVLNHTMGLPFDRTTVKRLGEGTIYTKTAHDIDRSSDGIDYICLFFGPFSIDVEVRGSKVKFIK